MNHLEKIVKSLMNINKKILEKVCGELSHPTENCEDSDINIDISSNNPTPSTDVTNMLGGMAEKLKSYNEDNSVENYIRITDECESFEVTCPDGTCIPYAYKCDGVDHCSDGLDESDQYCKRPNYFSCPEEKTVRKDQICDGRWDCADGSDEMLEICENMCPSPFFRIGGECFLEEWRDNSWYGAKSNCESKGLKLAQLHTKNYALLKQKVEQYSFWVDSYFDLREGFTWSESGLRIDGASDAFKEPRNRCLNLVTHYNPPWRNVDDCTDGEASLCERENFDVAETVSLSHFGSPDGFEWIGEHLVIVPGRGSVDNAEQMTWQESLDWCQQENFKPFVPATIKQWEDMRWILRKYQHNLKTRVWLPAFDEHINNNFTWSNGEDVSDELIEHWQKANEQDFFDNPPLDRPEFKDAQCLSLYRFSVTILDCNYTTIPMICEYTGDVMEAKVPVQKKKEMECGEILKNITSQDTYELDFLKIRGDEGATSHNRDHNPHAGFGYHVLSYQYWSSKSNVDLSTQPEALWYQFPAPIRVIKFAFQASRERIRNNPLHGPSKYEFFGSNSKNCSDQSAWETLFVDDSGTPFHNESHVKMETLDNRNNFRCYGIKVTEVPDPRYVMISAVRMWVQKDTFFRVGGESFKLIEGDGKSWYNARGICQCLDADLAQPDDPKYLYRYIRKHQIGDTYFGHYLGATDLSKEGDWKWLNGGSIDLEFKDEELENCLHLEYKHDRKPDSYLTTVSCIGGDYARPMCEKNDMESSGQKHSVFGLRGEYFVVVKESLSWKSARSYCQKLGGDLAIPKDITALRNYLFKNELIFDYWLGAEAEWGRDSMEWLDGEKVDFENIPSDYIGEKGQYFDFQVLKYPSTTEKIGEPYSQYFICETASLMREFAAVIGKPFEYEPCDSTWDPLKCEDDYGCFGEYDRCDGNNDCNDGSDEKYCGSMGHNIYIKIDSEKFLVNETKQTWHTAKKLCHSYGGYLAQPKDLLQLKNFLTENYSELTFWLGGSDLTEEGTWTWGSNGFGDPITAGWADDEPGTIHYDQDCLLFNTELNHEKSLSASGCNDKRAFVCETKSD